MLLYYVLTQSKALHQMALDLLLPCNTSLPFQHYITVTRSPWHSSLCPPHIRSPCSSSEAISSVYSLRCQACHHERYHDGPFSTNQLLSWPLATVYQLRPQFFQERQASATHVLPPAPRAWLHHSLRGGRRCVQCVGAVRSLIFMVIIGWRAPRQAHEIS